MHKEMKRLWKLIFTGTRHVAVFAAALLLCAGIVVSTPKNNVFAAENVATAGDAQAAEPELASSLQTVRNQAVQLEDGKFYYYDADGMIDKTPGWKKPSNSLHIYVGNDGYITNNFQASGNTWIAYEYQAASKAMVQMKSKWLNKEGNQYYFDVSGKAVIVSYGGAKCYKYESGKWNQLKNATCTLMDGKQYYFNSNGSGITNEGWVKVSENKHLYIGSAGYITYMMSKANCLWKLYLYNYSTKSWVMQTKVWKTAYGNMYYYDETGIASRVYYGSSQTCYNYTNGKYVLATNTACTLDNGKMYYFGSNGVCITKEGWYNQSSTKKIYVGGSGYIAYTMNQSNGIWKLYSYSTGSAVMQRSVWKVVNSDKYFFNSEGNATRIYYSSTKQCYDYSNGKWVMAKKTTKSILDKTYYFDASGTLVTKSGWYSLSNGKKAYVNASGYVTDIQEDLTQPAYYTIDLGNGKTTTVYGYYDTAMAEEITSQLNAYRISQGLSALTTTTELTKAANVRAYETSYYFDHTRPNGETCFSVSNAIYGENIAGGYVTATSVMTAWKNSSGHNANMLGGYSTVGISVFVAISGDNEGCRVYAVQNFGFY